MTDQVAQIEWEVEVSLGDVSKAHAKLTVGGKEYKLRRLEQGDSAAAEEWLRSHRTDAALELLRHKGYVDDSVVATVISDLMGKSYSVRDIWQSPYGEAFLIARGFAEPELCVEQVLNKSGPLKGVCKSQLHLAIMWMSGTPFDEKGLPILDARRTSTDSENSSAK